MASRSSEDEAVQDEYRNGWAALTELMDSGSSWSGHERNCSLVNVGDGTFCDVSTLSGVDFEDDGRGVAITDWDQDGRPDLWLRNRTGPQLRLLRNQMGEGFHFVTLSLRGRTCNRDAIGARVELQLGERVLARSLRAGSGYLAQSSKSLTFGVGASERIDRLTVTWPGGERQEFEQVAVDRFYELVQGEELSTPAVGKPVTLGPGAIEASESEGTRIVLRSPLPIPPDVLREILGERAGTGPVWIQLWAQWCAPCMVEMDGFVSNWKALSAAGLQIAAVTVDEDEDLERARAVFEERVGSRIDDPDFVYAQASPTVRAFFEVVLAHVLGKEGDGVLPTGFLIDRFGYLEIVAIGPADMDRLVRDTGTFGAAPEKVSLRAQFPGRWFFGMPRNLPALIQALERAGLESLARFYQLPGRQEGFKQR